MQATSRGTVRGLALLQHMVSIRFAGCREGTGKGKGSKNKKKQATAEADDAARAAEDRGCVALPAKPLLVFVAADIFCRQKQNEQKQLFLLLLLCSRNRSNGNVLLPRLSVMNRRGGGYNRICRHENGCSGKWLQRTMFVREMTVMENGCNGEEL